MDIVLWNVWNNNLLFSPPQDAASWQISLIFDEFAVRDLHSDEWTEWVAIFQSISINNWLLGRLFLFLTRFYDKPSNVITVLSGSVQGLREVWLVVHRTLIRFTHEWQTVPCGRVFSAGCQLKFGNFIGNCVLCNGGASGRPWLPPRATAVALRAGRFCSGGLARARAGVCTQVTMVRVLPFYADALRCWCYYCHWKVTFKPRPLWKWIEVDCGSRSGEKLSERVFERLK